MMFSKGTTVSQLTAELLPCWGVRRVPTAARATPTSTAPHGCTTQTLRACTEQGAHGWPWVLAYVRGCARSHIQACSRTFTHTAKLPPLRRHG